MDAVWYNPAGNARIGEVRIGTTHARFYPGLDEGLSLSALGMALPLGSGGLQTGFSSFGFDDWQEQVGVVGYGWSGHRRLALGASLWSVGWKAGELSRRTWRWDLGGTYEVGWLSRQAYLRLALVLRNLSRANISTGGHAPGETSRAGILGASLSVGPNELLVDIERREGRTEIRAGYEARTPSLGGIDLRMGGTATVSEWEGKELDVGLGRAWKGWRFDYAYSYPLRLNGWGGTHWVSFGYEGH